MQSNRFEVCGYLSAKPESRRLPSGTPVANARLGQTVEYDTKEGSKKHTNWFNLSFYGVLAGVATAYDKGDNVHIVGTLQQRQFTPKDGSTRTVYEVVVQQCHRVALPVRPQRLPAQAVATAQQNPSEPEEHNVDAWAAI